MALSESGSPETPSKIGLAERFYRWKVRKIADPSFQDWATRFPLTRPFVRAKGRALYDLVAGFVYSQTLLAMVQLDLPELLAKRGRTVDEVARLCGLSPDAARRLLQAGVAIDLLKRNRDGVYRLTQTGAALIGAPGVVEMIRHHPMLYADLADPVALLRGEVETEMSRFWGYVGGASTHDMQADVAAPYSALMAASQKMVAAETIAAFPFQGVRRIMDVGGGEGAFLSAVLRAVPDIEAVLFDLPAVAARGAERFAREGLSARSDVEGGSFLSDPFPKGADLISLIRVCYDHEDDVVRALLSKIRAALPTGGRILISEPMSGGLRPTREGDAYFGFYTAAMSTGRPRSLAEHGELLRGAGFTGIRPHPTRQPFITSVISGVAG